MDTSQTLFLMYIMDGYSFRNTIGIIKSETDYATMILSPKSIEISFLNTSKCAVHGIVLNTREFTSYRYNIRGDDGNLVENYPIAFDTKEMFNTTKGIGRRDAVRIYWLLDDQKLSVQLIKSGAKDPGRAGALFVNILTMEHTRYNTGQYNDEPNVRVQAKSFADICAEASSLKCASLEISGGDNSVTFRCILPNQTMASINKFTSQTDVATGNNKRIDNIDEVDNLLSTMLNTFNLEKSSKPITLNVVNTRDLMTVRVPISTVKAFSKIHNISHQGTHIRFYFAENSPIKIESPISIYGTYTVCIRPTRHPTSNSTINGFGLRREAETTAVK